jgi:hypothetical protein
LGGTEFLRLNRKPDPFCLRNPAVVSLPKADGSVYLFVTQEQPERGYELKETWAEIWKVAGEGFRTRRMIRNRANAKAYDELVKKRLLLEVN